MIQKGIFMNFLDLAKTRYSARKFDNREIEKDKIDKIIEVIKSAPTAKNNQPFVVYIIQSSEAVKKTDLVTTCRYGANTVIMITYKRSEEWIHPDYKNFHSGVEDAAIVATHIMLEAADLGLSTCYVNRFDPKLAKTEFDLSDDEEVVLMMPIGYSGEKPSERHNQSKDTADIVKFL